MSLGPFAAGLGKGYSSPALASLESLNALHHHHQTRHWGNSSAPIRPAANVACPTPGGHLNRQFIPPGDLFGGPLDGVAMRYGR